MLHTSVLKNEFIFRTATISIFLQKKMHKHVQNARFWMQRSQCSIRRRSLDWWRWPEHRKRHSQAQTNLDTNGLRVTSEVRLTLIIDMIKKIARSSIRTLHSLLIWSHFLSSYLYHHNNLFNFTERCIIAFNLIHKIFMCFQLYKYNASNSLSIYGAKEVVAVD